MKKQEVWTKRCRAGVACAGIYRNNPAFIPDDAPFGVCKHCLIALLDLDASSVCSCCGAGEDAVTEDSVIEAIKRIADGKPIVPRYVVLMWTVDIPGEYFGELRLGIFDTEDDPIEREPIKAVRPRQRSNWITTRSRLVKEAQRMSKEAA